MHANLKGRIQESLGHPVPDYVEEYFDRACELYRKLGYGEPQWQVIPLLVLMAEHEHRMGTVGGLDESDRRVDYRTREGRALKMATAV